MSLALEELVFDLHACLLLRSYVPFLDLLQSKKSYQGSMSQKAACLSKNGSKQVSSFELWVLASLSCCQFCISVSMGGFVASLC